MIVFLITLITGVVLLSVWYAMHRSATSLIAEIKAQMPASPPVEQGVPEAADAGEERLHRSSDG